ncbi:MAG: DNA-processing protein DprA [Actinobacteria bacterium]|nr:DNA-processing protein DprA [Actinomycetota bacterium]
MTASERTAYLFLSLLQARAGSSLISRLGDIPPAAVLEVPSAELAERMELSEKASRLLEELRRDFDPEAVGGSLSEKGISVLTLVDAGYPERLKEVPDPPPALFGDGKIPGATAVAIVGSRKASATGIETSRVLGRALGERGVCVVSGLALGVDAAAHEGALEAGGPTVGVLGCGVDIVYPRSNGRLFDRVKKNGAIVSEYYLGEAPLAWRFPARNRIIAGLCDAVVVVEAPQKSGALITAHHALECGRDVWAVPGSLTAQECRGSNKLLADGAGVLWDIEEFVDVYAAGVGEPAMGDASPGGDPPLPAELPETEATVLSGVGFEPTEVDAVAGRSGVEMPELLPALALLELKGYVTRNSGGAFVRRAAP